ncbi:MAG: tetratricopeptide repeat protein [Acidobacteriota bacterium]
MRGRLDIQVLKRERERQRVRQVEMASALGITERHYRRLENGEVEPTRKLLERLVDWAFNELDVPEGELLVPLPTRLAGRSTPSSSFIGREGELAELRRRHDGGDRLITLLGPPGVGKTRLALQHAMAPDGDWPGGAWFCDLAEANGLEDIERAVASTFEVPLGASPVDQLGHAIHARGRCLVILDNFEQVVEHAPATVGAWLERADAARFVVTSRELLRLPEECPLSLEPLSADAEGPELFAARARALQPGFDLTDQNRATLQELTRLLDGLPLAIELAAGRSRVLSPGQLLSRMKDRFRLLSGARGSRERQATLRAAIDWSWQALEPWEMTALAQSSVFEGGFTLDAAEAVLDLSDHDRAPDVPEVIQALVDKSLLQRWAETPDNDTPARPSRHALLVSVREYAAEKLRDAGGENVPGTGPAALPSLQERFGRHFATLGDEDRLSSLDLPGGEQLRHSLTAELDNLLAACRGALERNDGEVAVATLAAAWGILRSTGPLPTALELGKAALELPGLTPAATGRLHGSIVGPACMAAGEWAEAEHHLQRSLSIHRELAHRRLEGNAHLDVGSLNFMLGRMEKAGEHFDQALAIHRERGDTNMEASVLTNQGRLCETQGDVEQALEIYETARVAFSSVSNHRLEGIALNCLGRLHYLLGNFDEAQELNETALEVHRRVGNRRLESNVLSTLGLLDLARGRVESARTRHETALDLCQAIGNRPGESHCLGELGLALIELSHLEEAQRCLEKALRISRELGERQHAARLLGWSARLHGLQGRWDHARRALTECLEAHDELASAVSLEVIMGRPGLLGDAPTLSVESIEQSLAESERLLEHCDVARDSELGEQVTRLRELHASLTDDQS